MFNDSLELHWQRIVWKESCMSRYEIVIRNGIIVDGARNPRYRGDLGIKDGVITRIGRIPSGEADREIDASGLIVAPGFIDLHTHYDAQVFWDPYLTTSGWNGVTSVVIGNCGVPWLRSVAFGVGLIGLLKIAGQIL